ncbi:MAG TPA: peptide-methionine (S)-S-oxide reductase MsrA [Caulobacteraceae bacterium]|nr:peptide-methionine (S)-S-oxide reductase MsrA [Caulobacteraceae bacterium]
MRTLRNAALAAALIAFAADTAGAGALKTAVFAGGCFWSMQHGMEEVPGVVKVVAGYTGGHVDHPRYTDVTTETTGHYESVLVTYDPAKISYGQLVSRYFHLTDPTDGGGQFCDRGPSYRPAIFIADAGERAGAEAAKTEVSRELHGKRVATAILPRATFWPAEAYHQDYARTHAAAYQMYRIGCGRDASLKAAWR